MCKRLLLADLHSAQQLKSACISFIVDHVAELKTTKDCFQDQVPTCISTSLRSIHTDFVRLQFSTHNFVCVIIIVLQFYCQYTITYVVASSHVYTAQSLCVAEVLYCICVYHIKQPKAKVYEKQYWSSSSSLSLFSLLSLCFLFSTGGSDRYTSLRPTWEGGGANLVMALCNFGLREQHIIFECESLHGEPSSPSLCTSVSGKPWNEARNKLTPNNR